MFREVRSFDEINKAERICPSFGSETPRFKASQPDPGGGGGDGSVPMVEVARRSRPRRTGLRSINDG